jgi:tRNA-splicing ligase RtcB
MNKVEYKSWGVDIDVEARSQMDAAIALPISVAGALMPDAHVGYGLPIGGVLATENAVIPYGVGVDIACRMMMTLFDVPPTFLNEHDLCKSAIEKNTRFGVGAEWSQPKSHIVMDEDWNITRVTGNLKEKARKQLGTSGSGNHFVEFGEVTFDHNEIGITAGTYLALLSHSGSRGAGAQVAGLLHPSGKEAPSRTQWRSTKSCLA